MICLKPPSPSRRQPASLPHADAHRSGPRPSRPIDDETSYGWPFWLAFASNTLVATANALLYRYADLVTLLGGNELQLGWIIGLGIVGSLTMRFVLGDAIDRHGARTIWLVSLVVFALSCFAHLGLRSCHGPAIYLLRMSYTLSTAGIFGSALTWVSARASVVRMAELVGMLGAAGFLAMIFGTHLGDLLLGTQTIDAGQIRQMFIAAGCLGLAAMVFAVLATRGTPRPVVRRRRPPTLSILRRYNPGAILLVGVTLGMAVGAPGNFLRTFTAELGITRMAMFFSSYAATALATRVFARRLPERIGMKPMVLVGLTALVTGLLLFLPVRTAWQLVLPGMVFGIGHAITFPPLAAAGSYAFPRRYRGLAIMLVLASNDVGILIGAPLAGVILQSSGQFGLPPYPTMFATMAGVLVASGLVYAVAGRRGRAPRTSTAACVPAAEPSLLALRTLPTSPPMPHQRHPVATAADADPPTLS